jgi:hypothetical protein
MFKAASCAQAFVALRSCAYSFIGLIDEAPSYFLELSVDFCSPSSSLQLEVLL